MAPWLKYGSELEAQYSSMRVPLVMHSFSIMYPFTSLVGASTRTGLYHGQMALDFQTAGGRGVGDACLAGRRAVGFDGPAAAMLFIDGRAPPWLPTYRPRLKAVGGGRVPIERVRGLEVLPHGSSGFCQSFRGREFGQNRTLCDHACPSFPNQKVLFTC